MWEYWYDDQGVNIPGCVVDNSGEYNGTGAITRWQLNELQKAGDHQPELFAAS